MLEQIEQAPRRGHENIDTALECLALFSVTDTAVHERDSQIREPPVIAKGRLHLRGKFARGLEHKTSEAAVLCQQR